jgi:hypothetical protein
MKAWWSENMPALMHSDIRKRGWSLLLVLLPAACGCSKTATVTGKVTYQGRPVVHGSITFVRDAQTARSAAIQPDGSYTVEDVPLGTMKVCVFSRDPRKGRSVVISQQAARSGDKTADESKAPVDGWFPLPPKFEAAATSGLTCNVASRRVHHDLKLQ